MSIDLDALCDALRPLAAHDVVVSSMLHKLETNPDHCGAIIAGAVTAFAERDRSMMKAATDAIARSASPVFVRVDG